MHRWVKLIFINCLVFRLLGVSSVVSKSLILNEGNVWMDVLILEMGDCWECQVEQYNWPRLAHLMP